MFCLPVLSIGKPVVVLFASQEELQFASKEELSIASQEESKQFTSKEELLFVSKEESNKGSTPVVVVPTGFRFNSPVVKTTPPVVVSMEQNATVVTFSTPPVVVVPYGKNDDMGHQSSVVVNSLRKKSNQFADVLNNGVVINNSPDQCMESTNYFTQHHQDSPRPTTKLYGQIKNVV